jgi:hypothetical protein
VVKSAGFASKFLIFLIGATIVEIAVPLQSSSLL